MVGTLMGSIRQNKRDTLLAPMYVALESIVEVLIPLLMAMMIDNGINRSDMGYILSVGGAVIGLTALSFFFGIMSGKHAAFAAAGFAKNLRDDMYTKIQNFSFKNIDKFSPASLVTRLTTDVTNVQNAFMMIIRVLVRSPLLLFFSLAMSFGTNWKIALVFLCVIPFLGGGLCMIIKKAHPLIERVLSKYDKLNSTVQENVRGIRVVKSFTGETQEIEKFSKISEEIFVDYSKAERIIAFNSPLMQTAIYICMLLISWLGAQFIVGGSMTTGQMVSLITYAIQILMSLMMMSMVLVMVTIARSSSRRITEVLYEDSDIKNPDGAVLDINDGSVVFDNVSFKYKADGQRECLKDISFSIKSGETVGIMGETGSAKSSIVQLIPRLYDVNAGMVKVGGRDVREYDIDALRNGVAVVLQKNTLFSGSIKENLRWGDPDASDEELSEACRLAQAHGFISSFPDGYDTYIEQGGTNVSGGQRQRLCIARALLKKPKILILDDSTSAVDTTTDLHIRNALRENLPETTKIIIAQRVSSVQDADKIIVLHEGKINAIGTHEELLNRSDIYGEVYASQQNAGGDFDAEK